MVRAALRPSRLLAVTFAAVHVASAATLLPLALSVELKLACAVLMAASLIHSIRRHALLRGRRSITAIAIENQENGAVCAADSEWHDAKVLGTTYVTANLTVINMRPAGARLASHVLLTVDNIDAEDFRKIRVLLRWARPKPQKQPVDASGGPSAAQ
jgi:toxin CptA